MSEEGLAGAGLGGMAETKEVLAGAEREDIDELVLVIGGSRVEEEREVRGLDNRVIQEEEVLGEVSEEGVNLKDMQIDFQ